MNIDVILPSYNRAGRLGRAIESVFAARIPEACSINLFIIDNNSTDDTSAVIKSYCDRPWPARLQLTALFEPQQGKAFALNTGIAAGEAEVVAFFDDDEQIRNDWFEVIHQQFQDPEVEFIGGPYVPDWDGETEPDWLPKSNFSGVLGIIDNGPVRRRYGDEGFGAMLTGGNCIIRRETLAKCGPYTMKYVYAEDRAMYERLIEIEAVGFYVPDLVIFHHIPKKRLSKDYFRHWIYMEGRNEGRSFESQEARGRLLFNVPRWLWGVMLKSAWAYLVHTVRLRFNSAERFAAELEIIRVTGFYCSVQMPHIRPADFDRS